MFKYASQSMESWWKCMCVCVRGGGGIIGLAFTQRKGETFWFRDNLWMEAGVLLQSFSLVFIFSFSFRFISPHLFIYVFIYLFIYCIYIFIICFYLFIIIIICYSSWRPSFIILAAAHRALPRINAWLYGQSATVRNRWQVNRCLIRSSSNAWIIDELKPF